MKARRNHRLELDNNKVANFCWFYNLSKELIGLIQPIPDRCHATLATSYTFIIKEKKISWRESDKFTVAEKQFTHTPSLRC